MADESEKDQEVPRRISRCLIIPTIALTEINGVFLHQAPARTPSRGHAYTGPRRHPGTKFLSLRLPAKARFALKEGSVTERGENAHSS